MARHTGGWVKLHRSSLKHPIMDNFGAYGLFCALIQMANHEPSRIKFRTEIVELRAGEVLTSRRQLAHLMACTESTAERRLKWLEKCGSIEQRSDRQGRILTILNWDEYQVKGETVRTADRTTPETTIGQRSDNDRTTPETPNGEVEEVENERIKEISHRRPRVAYRYDVEDLKGAEWLQHEIRARNPSARRIDSANLEAWAQDIRLMREKDELSHHQIAETATWALNDPFWSAQIQSPASLRAQWDVLTAKMQKRRGGF